MRTAFKASEMVRKATKAAPPLPPMAGVKFGTLFAPYMMCVEYNTTEGWGKPEIRDFGPLSLMPQSGSLHYALQCFEGMKAYHTADGIRLFRPDMNVARLNSSHKRLAFPTVDEKEWVECLKEFVLANRTWIPAEEQHSLYLRPTTIATNHNLMVGPSDRVLHYIIASPVGPYYPTGFKPVRLVAENKARRAFPGGTGAYKLGANYAGPIMHQVEYTKKNFQQILWLAPDNTVDEVGAMNFMMLWKNEQGKRELITAPLDGTILPGVTRNSILQLARDMKEIDVVSEKRVHIDAIMKGLREGRVEELFGCGTAAIVTAVNFLQFGEEGLAVPCPETSVTRGFMEKLVNIQYGRTQGHPWSVKIADTA